MVWSPSAPFCSRKKSPSLTAAAIHHLLPLLQPAQPLLTEDSREPQEPSLMASAQAETVVELDHLNNATPEPIRIEASQVSQDESITADVSPRSITSTQKPPRRSLVLSWPWPSSTSATKWRQKFHTTLDTVTTIMNMATFPLTVLGTWMALDALKASRWTQSKDTFEWCEDHKYEYPGCEALMNKSLSIPSDLSPFKRSEKTSGDENTQCFLDRHLCLPNSSIGLAVLSIACVCILFLQITTLWMSRGHLLRTSRSLLRTMSANNPAIDLQLEKGLVENELQGGSRGLYEAIWNLYWQYDKQRTGGQEFEEGVSRHKTRQVSETCGRITPKLLPDHLQEAIDQTLEECMSLFQTLVDSVIFPASSSKFQQKSEKDSKQERLHENEIAICTPHHSQQEARLKERMYPREAKYRKRRSYVGASPRRDGQNEKRGSSSSSSAKSYKKSYKKTIHTRPSAVVHNENARSYDRNEPHPSFSASASAYRRGHTFQDD